MSKIIDKENADGILKVKAKIKTIESNPNLSNEKKEEQFNNLQIIQSSINPNDILNELPTLQSKEIQTVCQLFQKKIL